MTTTATQQVALNNALVPLEKRVEIGKCNLRIDPAKTQKEPPIKLAWTLLHLPLAILLSLSLQTEIFQICPKLPNQEFDALPSDEEIVSFIKELGHKGDIKYVSDAVVDHMYQPWRTFASIINKCLSGKITGLDKLRISRAKILWGMFYKKNVDFVELLWEDFTFQIENKDTKKQEKMYYPRFTKAIIHHFITKDKSISMRNRMFMHTAEDDNILGLMRFVSKSEDFQVYGALLPEVMTNQKMQNSRAYKTYLAYATGAATPKKARKFKKPASPSKKRTLVTIEEEEPEPAKKVVPPKKPSRKQSTGVQIRDTSGGPSEGADFKSVVPGEPKGKSIDTSEGTGLKPGIPDVSKTDSSKSEYESWGDSGDEANVQGDDEDVQDSDDEPQQVDAERTNYENQEINDDEEKSNDEFIHTPLNYVRTDDETNDESNDVDEEEFDRIDKELYGDVNVSFTDAEQDDGDEEDADMIDVAHV
ncbi:hypothetical protein Tco_0339543 [Tanacetum coccineum]